MPSRPSGRQQRRSWIAGHLRKYREAGRRKIPASPVVVHCVTQCMLENGNAHSKDRSGFMAWDYSRARQPLDLRYADASGGGKTTVPKCAALVLLPSPVPGYCCAGRAGQRLAMPGMRIDFNIPISGIVMRNQNAAPHQGTPTTTSIRRLKTSPIAWLYSLVTGLWNLGLLLMPL